MTTTAVIGTQWGDEGKGRVVDYIAQDADIVIRFQGGDNAGHTVVNEFGTFALHMVPSGIFNPDCLCIVGTGCVVNPENLLKELASVEEAGVSTANLKISSRAQLVMPYHPVLDAAEENARKGDSKIGTTKRGIGPAYADKAARIGLRAGDLLHPEFFEKRLRHALERKEAYFKILGAEMPNVDDLLAQAKSWRNDLGNRIVDTIPLMRNATTEKKKIVLEGQLGVMRDLDWGTYPYVTSSNPTAAFAPVGAGMPPGSVDRSLGIVKAYTTSVGAGPFPTELDDDNGKALQQVGKEFGATTGRVRRCGWFDAVAVKHAAWLNGLTHLAITKLDVLDGFESLELCTGYELEGKRIDYVPDGILYESVKPIYETWPGWTMSTIEVRSWDKLPEAAQNYVRRISELANVPIAFVSVGPERDQLIVMEGF